ncbi:hypothetical protein C8J36_10389 [Rhizobium sp. PP-F2F-G48]|nr:hypothetical protein C8J36_10389 [Rhizobium sp. PP-F2F-G48]
MDEGPHSYHSVPNDTLVAEEIRSLYAQDGALTPLTEQAKAALEATPAIKVGAEKACDPV